MALTDGEHRSLALLLLFGVPFAQDLQARVARMLSLKGLADLQVNTLGFYAFCACYLKWKAVSGILSMHKSGL